MTHKEKHLKSSDFITDMVIGMSDGLTVPFALAAGLSGAVSSNTIVITAGIAEIVAGCIAMGLGGYLAGKTEQKQMSVQKHQPHQPTQMHQHQQTKQFQQVSRVMIV